MIGMPWPLSQVSVVPPRVSGLFRNVFENVFSCHAMTTYFNVAAAANFEILDLEIDVLCQHD